MLAEVIFQYLKHNERRARVWPHLRLLKAKREDVCSRHLPFNNNFYTIIAAPTTHKKSGLPHKLTCEAVALPLFPFVRQD